MGNVDCNSGSNTTTKKGRNDLRDHQGSIHKLWYSHTVEYYVGIKMSGLELHVLRCTNLKNVTVNVNKQIHRRMA